MAVTPPRTVTPPNQTRFAGDVSYRNRSFAPTMRARGRHSATDYPRVNSASPEVINSLISSLDAISRDTKEHFENIPDLDGAGSPSPSLPVQDQSTRGRGVAKPAPAQEAGFGVEYGASGNGQTIELPYIDDAAEPPVVRTSKPPSGFSLLTAPGLSKQSSVGSFKNYLRSTKSSNSLRTKQKEKRTSSDNYALNVDAVSSPLGSRESSVSRQGKAGHKGLRFMSSKEGLRAKDTDRKRLSPGSPVAERDELQSHDSGLATVPQVRTPSPKQPILAETTIQEESTSPSQPQSQPPESIMEKESPIKAGKRKMERVEPTSPATTNGHTLIPERGSSLRHPHSPRNSKIEARRSSRRSSLQQPKQSNPSSESSTQSPNKEKPPPNETEEEKVTRRIRELKAQKERRMRESGPASPASQKTSKSQFISRKPIDTKDTATNSKFLVDPEAREKQSNVKARKMLGIPITPPQSPDRGSELKSSRPAPPPVQLNYTAADALAEFYEPDSPGFLAEYNKALDLLLGKSNPSTRPGSESGPNRRPHAKADIVTPPERNSSKRNRHRWSQTESSIRSHDKGLRNSVRDDLLTVRKASMENTAGEGRPSSIDSIDMGVDDFLRSPRLSQKATDPQSGRVIMFSEVGDPKGYAVFCCVGMGLTRFVTAFYDELATTLKLRLITPDRPGIGGSEPCPEREGTPLGWPDDVLAICQVLRINKFSLLAHSAGAIYALATALRLPQHIRGRVHLLAPWIPPSQMSAIGLTTNIPPSGALPRSQRFLRVLPTTFLKAANSSLMRATSSSVSPNSSPRNPRKSADRSRELSGAGGHGAIPPPAMPARRESLGLMDRIIPDPASVTDLPRGNARGDSNGFGSSSSSARRRSSQQQAHPPQHDRSSISAAALFAEKERKQAFDNRLTMAIWELATTHANPAVDLLVCLERTRNIGFRYVDITRSVVIHHGSQDTRVPVENVRWLGSTMRKCEVRILEQEGHGLMASAVVMGNVLMEIAKEWDEWTRAAKGARGERRRD
ncbi:MAG: hypothetical protein Q9165_005660 [Trypethelium subeluteriae]